MKAISEAVKFLLSQQLETHPGVQAHAQALAQAIDSEQTKAEGLVQEISAELAAKPNDAGKA